MNFEIQIPDVLIKEKIGEGSTCSVFRAICNGHEYALRIFKSVLAETYERQLTSFKREAAILGRIRHPGIPQIMTVGDVNRRPYMIMDFIDGENLSDSPLAREPNEQRVIKIGIGIADALSALHQLGLSHRDIKPENIILDRAERVHLVDFQFAKETTQEVATEQFAGTAIYSSPEQLGVLSTSIDGRSDLFSMGAVLYRLIAGQIPSQATNFQDAIEFYANKKIIPPREINPNISENFSGLLLKLLSIDPIDRYQTAHGLLLDLRALLDGIPQGHAFQFGKNDSLLLNNQEVQLVGRASELENLRQTWNRKNGELAIVCGPSGSGKSRLIRELCRTVASDQAIVSFAKCSELNQARYLPWRAVLDDVLIKIQLEKTASSPQSLQQILKSANGAEEILGEISPQFRLLSSKIGLAKNSDSVSEVSNEIIGYFISQLLKTFPRVQIVLDDVQWLDEASTEVLGVVAKNIVGSGVMIVMSARDDFSSAPKLERIKRLIGGTLVNSIQLQPLSEMDLSELIKVLLGGTTPQEDLTQFILSRSNGVPFAAQEYLHLMIDAGAITPNWGNWKLNQDLLKNLEIPKNLKDIVLNRLKLVPENQFQILKAAAVIGSTFNAEMLAAITDLSKSQVNSCLNRSIEIGLVEIGRNDHFDFVHDSIMEALLQSADSAQLKNWNHLIALEIEKKRDRDWSDIYSLAQHYYNGHPEQNPQAVVSSQFQAGELELNQHSNQKAEEFFLRGLELAEKFSISISEKIYKLLGQAQFQNESFDLSIQSYQKALQLTEDPIERALIISDVARIHLAQLSCVEGWAMINRAFIELGSPLPKNILFVFLQSLFQIVGGMILEKTNFLLGAQTVEKRRLMRAQTSLTSIAGELAYYSLMPLQTVQMASRLFYYASRSGKSSELVGGLSRIAVVFVELKMRRLGLHYAQKAVDLSIELGEVGDMAFAEVFLAFAQLYSGNNLKFDKMMTDFFLQRKDRFIRPDLVIGCYSNQGFSRITRGKYKEALTSGMDLLERVKKNALSENDEVHVYSGVAAISLEILGQTNEANQIFQRIDSSKMVVDEKPFNWATYLNFLTLLAAERGRADGRTAALLIKFKKLNMKPEMAIYHFRFAIAMSCYTDLEECISAWIKNETVDTSKLKLGIQAVNKLNAVGPLLGHKFVLNATMHLLNGKTKKALRLLNEAEKVANQLDAPGLLLEVFRFMSHIKSRQGDKLSGEKLFNLAFEIAVGSGSLVRQQRLKAEFASYNYKLQANAGSSMVQGTQANFNVAEQRMKKHLEALVSVNRSSAELFDTDKQIRSILTQIVKAFGAERAVLFKADGKNNFLEFKDGFSASEGPLTELKGYSSTVVNKSMYNKTPIITNASDFGEVDASASAVVYGLRSMMAAPIISKDQVVGVIYLDNSVVRGAFREDDLNVLAAIASQIGVAFDNANNAKNEVEKRELEKDLELSSSVQKMLLPNESTFESGQMSCSAFYRPASQCSGDWWWHNQSPLGPISILVGDVTGHGAGPAMITASIAGAFKLMFSSESNGKTLGDMMDKASGFLLEMAKGEYLMSTVGLEFTESNRLLKYWFAGAPAFYVLTKEQKINRLSAKGSLMGLPEFELGFGEVQLEVGDRLFICTDGIFEMQTPGGKELGQRRLIQMIQKLADRSPVEACQELIEELDQLRGNLPQDDDYTFLIADIR